AGARDGRLAGVLRPRHTPFFILAGIDDGTPRFESASLAQAPKNALRCLSGCRQIARLLKLADRLPGPFADWTVERTRIEIELIKSLTNLPQQVRIAERDVVPSRSVPGSSHASLPLSSFILAMSAKVPLG